MRLVLTIPPSALEFTQPIDGGPYPLLMTIGTLRQAVRAGTPTGLAATEAESVTVTLDNTSNVAAALVGQPLRMAAEIYDGETLYFAGTVASIRYGRTVEMTVEA
jgi:hypothetical protein